MWIIVSKFGEMVVFLLGPGYYPLQIMFHFRNIVLTCLQIKETCSPFKVTLLLEKSLMFASP